MNGTVGVLFRHIQPYMSYSNSHANVRQPDTVLHIKLFVEWMRMNFIYKQLN